MKQKENRRDGFGDGNRLVNAVERAGSTNHKDKAAWSGSMGLTGIIHGVRVGMRHARSSRKGEEKLG